jgi:hypothetical protein
MMKISFYFLFTVALLMSCAGSRYQKADELYEMASYQELVQSGLDCSEYNQECFRLKYYRTISFFETGDIDAAINASQEAIDRINKDTPLSQINRVYALRTDLIQEILAGKINTADRMTNLRELETDYRKIINILTSRDREDQYRKEIRDYQIQLIESLLERMRYLTGRNLKILYDRILDIIGEFDATLLADGYDRYYKIQAGLYRLLPEINDWIYQGKLEREREEFLTFLKNLYKEALTLRNIPLYQKSKSDSIEKLITDIDSYMKQLVL